MIHLGILVGLEVLVMLGLVFFAHRFGSGRMTGLLEFFGWGVLICGVLVLIYITWALVRNLSQSQKDYKKYIQDRNIERNDLPEETTNRSLERKEILHWYSAIAISLILAGAVIKTLKGEIRGSSSEIVILPLAIYLWATFVTQGTVTTILGWYSLVVTGILVVGVFALLIGHSGSSAKALLGLLLLSPTLYYLWGALTKKH